MRRAVSVFCLLLVPVACGSPPPPAVVLDEPKVAEDLPTWCSEDVKPCRPSREFVERLCQGSFPGTALYLFQKSSPWQRRWVKTRGIAVPSTTGRPASGELQFAEEVLLMSIEEPTTTDAPNSSMAKSEQRKTHSGKAPSGKITRNKTDAELKVLRWDGVCVSVKGSDTVTFQPGAQKHAAVSFESLDLSVQRSLLRDSDIEKARATRKTACESGAKAGCDEADQALSGLVVAKVRRGTKLSMPDIRP